MSASAISQQVGMATAFDTTKFTYLGRATVGPRVLYTRKDLNINTLQDLIARSQQKPILMGTSGFGSFEHENALVMSYLLKDIANIDLKIEFAHFSGSGEILTSMQRGEIELGINSIIDAQVPQKNGYGNIIVQVNKQRSEYLPNVPTILEAGILEKAAADIEEALFFKSFFVASPKINKDLADVFGKAMEMSLKDQEFLKKAKEASLIVDYVAPADDLKSTQNMLTVLTKYKSLLQTMFK